MLRRVLHHTRRNAVAYLALFVALPSGSYAAATKLLPANSVGTQQVINGSLQKADLSARTQAALRGVSGARGLRGPGGPGGPQGPAGSQGVAGPQGVAGLGGERGPAGTAYVTRIRNVGSVSGNAKWPLTANIWPQSTSATDLLYGEATVRFPTTCTSSDPNYPAYGHVDVFLDNEFVGGAYFGFYPGGAGTEQKSTLYMNNGVLLAPDTDTTHLLTATVADNCTGADEDFTFESFRVEVISIT